MGSYLCLRHQKCIYYKTYSVENSISNYYFHTINKCNGSDRIYFIMLVESGWNRGSTVVKVLCYKSEGRWFDPSWCHWNFSFDIKSFRSHYDPGVDSTSNRNEYQEHFLGVRRKADNLTTILCRCHEIWEP